MLIKGMNHTGLVVNNLDGSIHFYRDVIGLEVIGYIKPEAELRLSEERAVIGASHIGFEVENIEETAKHMVEKGARILNPPAAIIPGRFSCYLQDPDGNWLEFVEDLNA